MNTTPAKSKAVPRFIRAVLALVVVLGLALGLNALGTSRYQTERQTYAQATARTAHELGQKVLKGLNDAMMTNGRANIARILDAAKDYGGVKRILVIGPQGHVYISSSTPEVGGYVSTGLPGCTECHAHTAELPTTSYLKFLPDQVRAATPIGVTTGCNSCHVSSAGSKLGVVLVDMSLAAGEAVAQTNLTIWQAISIAAALVIGGGVYWLLGPRTRPFRRPDRSTQPQGAAPATVRRGWRRVFASKWARLGVIAGALGLLALIGGGLFAYQIETTNAGCATCHTQPETVYVDRTQAQPIDLASLHAAENLACIDCHSGAGTLDRAEAVVLGARNFITFVLGQNHHPAEMRVPFDDAGCAACHADLLTDAHSTNHYHFYLARWQALSPGQAGTCASCHHAHAAESQLGQTEPDAGAMDAVCQRCHAQARSVAVWP